jgi:hypothetical protein
MVLISAVTGCGNTLVFGTATKLGLDISQRPDQMIDVTMGYDRYEIVSIPAQNKDSEDFSGNEDTYSVLAVFAVSYGNPWTEPLILRQFFATGWAARKAAEDPRFQRYFGHKTGQIIQNAEQEIKAQKRGQGQ